MFKVIYWYCHRVRLDFLRQLNEVFTASENHSSFYRALKCNPEEGYFVLSSANFITCVYHEGKYLTQNQF